ncbi:MAG TPA: hypothetical protein VM327_10235 [Candidatus Thermoplasmatota archaeon]|nr:hypothetical protein [Candidatus Thermoplasmatota archaeon]
MNPLAKAIGTVLVLAAGTLGASLEEVPILGGLPFRPPSADDGDGGNGTSGNGTAGNKTADGNETAPDGNETSDGNETTPDGNETADGNQTADDGNETVDGNETSRPDQETERAPVANPAVCSYRLDEYGNDLTPRHHEWEWLVTKDVQHLWVSFSGYGGLPTGLSGHPDIRLIDGSGRTVAHSQSDDGHLELYLERGVDYLAGGTWRLVYDTSDAFADYYAQVGLDCMAGHATDGDSDASDEDGEPDETDEDDG